MGLSGGCGFGCVACRRQSGGTHQAVDLAPKPGTYLRVEPELFAAFAVAVVRFAGKAPVTNTLIASLIDRAPASGGPNDGPCATDRTDGKWASQAEPQSHQIGFSDFCQVSFRLLGRGAMFVATRRGT